MSDLQGVRLLLQRPRPQPRVKGRGCRYADPAVRHGPQRTAVRCASGPGHSRPQARPQVHERGARSRPPGPRPGPTRQPRHRGGGIAVIGGESASTALHEFGHAFGGLADEYSSNTGHRRGVRAVNATTDPDRDKAPWKHWYEKSKVVGFFEGANGMVRGAWKPTKRGCVMGSGGSSFCIVCREQLVKRIYGIVRPIDDATRGGQTRTLTEGEPLELFVRPMKPRRHDLDVEWRLERLESAPAAKSSKSRVPRATAMAAARPGRRPRRYPRHDKKPEPPLVGETLPAKTRRDGTSAVTLTRTTSSRATIGSPSRSATPPRGSSATTSASSRTGKYGRWRSGDAALEAVPEPRSSRQPTLPRAPGSRSLTSTSMTTSVRSFRLPTRRAGRGPAVGVSPCGWPGHPRRARLPSAPRGGWGGRGRSGRCPHWRRRRSSQRRPRR